MHNFNNALFAFLSLPSFDSAFKGCETKSVLIYLPLKLSSLRNLFFFLLEVTHKRKITKQLIKSKPREKAYLEIWGHVSRLNTFKPVFKESYSVHIHYFLQFLNPLVNYSKLWQKTDISLILSSPGFYDSR